MTTTAVEGATSAGRRPRRPCCVRDGVIAESGPALVGRGRARSSTPTGSSRCRASSTCTPTCASPAGRTPRPSRRARAPPPSAASPPSTRWRTPTRSRTPPGSSSRCGALGLAAGRCDVHPVGAVTVGLAGERLAELGAMADSRRPGAGVLRRRSVRERRGPDAPRAGVRQGLRRRHRAARAGAATDRGRPDERGRPLRRARSQGLAGGRRGGDHRPRRPARRARRVAAACLPCLHRGLGRHHPLGQGAGDCGDRRGHAPPPAAHRRPRDDLRPALQGQPSAARQGRRRGAARRSRRRHHRRGRHRPRTAPP